MVSGVLKLGVNLVRWGYSVGVEDCCDCSEYVSWVWSGLE